jgi:hypothetical protein
MKYYLKSLGQDSVRYSSTLTFYINFHFLILTSANVNFLSYYSSGNVSELNDIKDLRNLSCVPVWLMSVILVTQEAEIRRITVQSQPGQIVPKTLYQKNSSWKKGWWSGSRCRPWVQTPVPHTHTYTKET